MSKSAYHNLTLNKSENKNMNDILNNNQSGEAVAEITPEMAAASAKQREKDIATIKKQYFTSSQMDQAQTVMGAMNDIAVKYNLDVVFNFDIEKEFPEGFGIGIVPISKRNKGENIVLGVAIAQIPDIETIEKHENGKAFVLAAVSNNMMAKLANAVRPRGDNDETASSIPASVEDFITSNRPEGVLLGFNTYASAYVKVLKKSGLKLLTTSILRQALQSKAFAEQQFPRITQDKWVKILESMIARAEKDQIAVGMLADWVQARDSAELVNNDVDLGDLDFGGLDADEDSTTDDAEQAA